MEGLEYISKNGKIKPNLDTDMSRYGVIPRVANYLFEEIEKRRSNKKYRVECSYYQIYNENVYDMLNVSQHLHEGNKFSLRVRWSKDRDFHVENLFQYECKTPEQVM